MFRKASVVLIAIVLLLTGCSSPSGGHPKENQLVVGTHTTPDTLDPSRNNAAAIPYALLYNVYQTLVRVDSEGNLQRLLASDYQISTDRLTYTFTLRQGAKFSSGAPVDAKAVEKTMNYILTDERVNPTRKAEIEALDSVKAISDTQVEFKLKHPSNSWLYAMAGPVGIIYDPAGLDADNLATQPAGSGPYVLKEWLVGESIELAKSPNYWGTDARVESVTFKYFADPNAMNTAMLSGSIDVISNVTAPQALSQFSDDQQFSVLEGTTNGEIVLGMNQQREALKDVRVRQAINYAIDRKGLMDSVWAGKGLLIGSMVPPTDPWYEDLSNAYPYDPEKAKTLLAEAGYAGGLTLALRVPTLPYATASGTYIASQLEQVGIKTTIDQVEFPARWIDEVMVKSNYDLTIVSHVEPRDIARFADPNYYWHYDSEEFRQLILKADEADGDAQITYMKQAAKLLSDDAAADFLWLLPNLIVTKSEVVGIAANVTGFSFDLTSVAVKDE